MGHAPLHKSPGGRVNRMLSVTPFVLCAGVRSSVGADGESMVTMWLISTAADQVLLL
jgi:hypothetical protein